MSGVAFELVFAFDSIDLGLDHYDIFRAFQLGVFDSVVDLYDQVRAAPAAVFVERHEGLLRRYADVPLVFPGYGRC